MPCVTHIDLSCRSSKTRSKFQKLPTDMRPHDPAEALHKPLQAACVRMPCDASMLSLILRVAFRSPARSLQLPISPRCKQQSGPINLSLSTANTSLPSLGLVLKKVVKVSSTSVYRLFGNSAQPEVSERCGAHAMRVEVDQGNTRIVAWWSVITIE